MMCQEGIIKNNLHKPSFTRSFDSMLPPEFRSTVQPLPFGKCQAGEWGRIPKWLIKSHSDATRASWKIPLMSAVSNVSHRKSHKRQQPSQANYWGRGAAENGQPWSPRAASTQAQDWAERSFVLLDWRGSMMSKCRSWSCYRTAPRKTMARRDDSTFNFRIFP